MVISIAASKVLIPHIIMEIKFIFNVGGDIFKAREHSCLETFIVWSVNIEFA